MLKNGKKIRKCDLAVKRPSAPKKIRIRKKNQLVKFYAIKGPRKVTHSSRNVGFKSSNSTQKKRNLQANFEELDIARRNAAMTISRETLIREEEEERKRLRYPIGLEIIQEASPTGYITCPQTMNIPELTITQTPTEIKSDNDASNLILLKDLKPLVSSNLENRQEKSAQEQTKVKQEVLRKDETSIEKENRVCHTPIDIDSGDENPDHGATPPLVQLDSHE